MAGSAEEARTLHTIATGHEEPINDTQLDYYGKKLATAASDGVVKIWDTADATAKPVLKAELRAHNGPVWGVAWAHPRFPGVVASCGYDKLICVYKEEANGSCYSIAHKDTTHRASVNGLAFSPAAATHGLALAAASSDGSLSVLTYGPGAGNRAEWGRTAIPAHPGGALSVEWASTGGADPQQQQQQQQQSALNGSRLVSGGADCAVRVHRNENNQWVKETVDNTAARHTDWVTSVSSSGSSGPKGGGAGVNTLSDDIADVKLVSGGKDGRVIIWKWDNSQQPGCWRAAQVLEVASFLQVKGSAAGAEPGSPQAQAAAAGQKIPEGVNHPVSKVAFAHVGTMILVSYSAETPGPAENAGGDGAAAAGATKRSQSVLLKEGTGGKFEQVLEMDGTGFNN